MKKISKRTRSRMMSRIRTSGTKPELAVRRWLRSRGFGYRTNVKGMPGTPDIVLSRYGVVIHVHGCFWHNCPKCGQIPKGNHDFWKNKLDSNTIRDANNEKKLQDMGWDVIVVWECETGSDDDISRKLSTLEQRRTSCRTKRTGRSTKSIASSMSKGILTRRKPKR